MKKRGKLFKKIFESKEHSSWLIRYWYITKMKYKNYHNHKLYVIEHLKLRWMTIVQEHPQPTCYQSTKKQIKKSLEKKKC